MPVQLTTPFNPGDADPTAKSGYPFLQLVNFVHNPLTFAVYLEYQFGTSSGEHYEVWQKGAGSPTVGVDVSGPDVAQIWGQSPKDGESVGAAVRRCTYEYLINVKGIEGTVVDAPPLPPVAPPATAEDTAADSANTDATSASKAS